MTKKLFDSVSNLRRESKPKKLFGRLGKGDVAKTVEVPGRDSFVYVRLRETTNELIQAFNEKVAPQYDLPVEIERRGNIYYIVGRDIQQYTDWGSFSPFLPRHGDTHSFNDTGGGGDIVWVYQKQFMPLLAIPSGTDGGPNVIINSYMLRNDTGWNYVAAQSSGDIAQYRPPSGAIMALVYLNRTTATPGFVINSGSYFSESLTGTSQVAPYIPYLSNTSLLPIVAVRLVSGTTTLSWNNLYDVRQFIDYYTTGSADGSTTGFITGSWTQLYGTFQPSGTGGGGGTGTPGGVDGDVQYNNAGDFGGDSNLQWDDVNKILRVGPTAPSVIASSTTTPFQVIAPSQNNTVSVALVTYGTGTSGNPTPTYNTYRMRGDTSTPTAVQNSDGLFMFVGAGYDGSAFINSARIRGLAYGDWSAGGNNGSIWNFELTPSGTTTRITFASMRDKVFNVSGSMNIPAGETYNVNNIPHTHNNLYQPSGTYPNDISDGLFKYQHGTATGTCPSGSTNTEITITFPIAFTTILQVLFSVGPSGNFTLAEMPVSLRGNTKSNTQASIFLRTTDGGTWTANRTVIIDWFAIGT